MQECPLKFCLSRNSPVFTGKKSVTVLESAHLGSERLAAAPWTADVTFLGCLFMSIDMSVQLKSRPVWNVHPPGSGY